MATLVDYREMTKTHGSTDNLISLAETILITRYPLRLANKRRAVASLMTSAIRRDGAAEGLHLELSQDERDLWDAAHPVPED